MKARENDDSQIFDNQKMLAQRLYDKIDYHKTSRLRIPAYVAIANFGLLALATRAILNVNEKAIFSVGFVLICAIDLAAMRVIQNEFKRNVEQLDYIYTKMQNGNEEHFRKVGTPSLAEPASPLWNMLFFLIVFSSALALSLLWSVEFLPLRTRF